MVYFIDKDNRYIGARELKADEPMPSNAVDVPVALTNGQEAHFVSGAWVISDIVVEPVQIVPVEPTEAERLDALEDAMLFII